MTDTDARAIAEQIREWARYCFTTHGNDAHLYNGLSDLAVAIAAAIHAAHQAGREEAAKVKAEKKFSDAPDYYDNGDEAQAWANGYNDALIDLRESLRARAEEHKAQ